MKWKAGRRYSSLWSKQKRGEVERKKVNRYSKWTYRVVASSIIEVLFFSRIMEYDLRKRMSDIDTQSPLNVQMIARFADNWFRTFISFFVIELTSITMKQSSSNWQFLDVRNTQTFWLFFNNFITAVEQCKSKDKGSSKENLHPDTLSYQ